jgi:multicomponent Na+:H+ antiporter subunit F
MNIIEAAFFIIIPILSLAMILAFVRVLRGPSLPDRVVALDLLATLGVGIIAAYAVVAKQPVFLDVAVVLALLAFLGTVAFAYYIQRRA